jgi:hypothetical protein
MAKQRQPQGAPMTPGNSRKNATSRSSMVDLSFLTFRELVDSTGRRDVRIFGLPREQLIMVAVAVALFGVPLMIIVAMVPVRDLVGEFAILKQFNSYAAPAVRGSPTTIERRGGTAISDKAISDRVCIDR